MSLRGIIKNLLKEKRLQNISILFFSVILILAILEVLVRLSGYREIYEQDEKSNIKWQDEAKQQHNSMGYRDYDYSKEKPKGVFRIYVLGDSFTYGQGIKMTETYPKVLERLLNNKYSSKHFEVINSSFLGFDTEKEFERLKNQGLRLSPDMIITGFCLNDPSPDSGMTQWHEEDKKEKIKILFNNKKLLNISDLYWFLKIRIDWLLGKRIFMRAFLKLYDKDSKDWKNFEKSFNGICELSMKNKIPLLVVIFPYFHQLNENYPFYKAHSMVKELCDKNRVKVLDLFYSYKGISSKSFWVKTTLPTNTHPNAKAHQIAGMRIFKTIINDSYFKVKSHLGLE